jgi:LysR family transcriptional regulator, hypochlorite-specific transcription factor HypT
MDLDWLKDFLVLAEQKNFSRAADVRNVMQPAFSRRIRALEDWVGTPLFVRGAQGAVLTPAGAYLQPLAAEMMRNLDRARRDTRAVGERNTVTLSIAATHALSFTFFPGWIRRHVRFDAQGTLNLISDSMESCEQMLLGGEVHFLLCHYHPDALTRLEADRFPSVQVGDDVLVPLCSPDTNGQLSGPRQG